jgi:putative aminopeptidase FrvX
VAVPELLQSLLVAPGPSGQEAEPARVWREAGSAFADVTSDTMGSSFARVAASGAPGAPVLAIVGHIDEIGIAVTNVEESGLLSFATIGGISAEMLLGQRFELLTQNGRVPGVIGRRRLKAEESRDRVRLELSDLHLDIGAKDRAGAEALVRVGDAAVWAGAPLELPNGRLVSRSLDNRLGAFVALEAARRVAGAGGAQFDVVAVAAVQEELGLHGARTAGFGLEPTVAIAVDVTYATDYPGGNPSLAGRVDLGGGVMIARSPTLNRKVVDGLGAAATQNEIAHAYEVYTRDTHTDADELHLSRAGIPTALLSIPLRYMHSPTELCDLADVESAVQLVAAYALSLARDESFVR